MSTSPQGSRHSQASLSPNNSQSKQDIDIPLETLVSHLLASKRSLSSISGVLRANEIVTSARTAVEESIILESRTAFLRTGISQQARILRKVRNGVDHVFKEGKRDFQETLRSLDATDNKLKKTMEVLRSTIVDSAFRPANEEPRSLLHFVDEAGVETTRSALRYCIDQSQEAQAEFLESIQSYDKDIKSIKSAITSSTSTSSHLESPIPHLIQSLEENAAEMASLLESLVQHFDLCVNAIKHTEGGFAAVKKAATDNQLPDGVTVSGVIEEPGNDSGLEPLSDEDRRQMLTVLSNDATEVEDVVLELHQRLQSMEEQHDQIQDHVGTLSAAYTSTISAFTILEIIGSRLPTYIASSQDFLLRWTDSKAQIGEQMEELESMRIFYEGYMTSYHGLIEEVARRRAAEEKMRNMLKKTMEQVKKLHDADKREREAFRRHVWDYLPSDLWPGLVADAPRFEITVVGEEVYGEGEIEIEENVRPAESVARG